MARISTYQHDAMPHAEDNVIGTNQSPGHASETVLFSLSAIETLFRSGLIYTQTFSSTNYTPSDTATFYGNASNLVIGGMPGADTSSIPDATMQITHNLNKTSPIVFLFLEELPLEATGDTAVFGSPISIGQVGPENDNASYSIAYDNANQLTVTFDFKKSYQGTILIIG